MQIEIDKLNHDFMLRICKNIEWTMSKAKRARTFNITIVSDYILQGTSRAGSTSCTRLCFKMGVDPHGYSFYKE